MGTVTYVGPLPNADVALPDGSVKGVQKGASYTLPDAVCAQLLASQAGWWQAGDQHTVTLAPPQYPAPQPLGGYCGTYNPNVTYSQGHVVTQGSQDYLLMAGPATGVEPSQNPTSWHPFPGGSPGGSVTKAAVLQTGIGAGDLNAPTQLTPVVVSNANSPYTASAWQLLLIDNTGGNVVVNYPSSPGDKAQILRKVVKYSTSNTITINAGGSSTFNLVGGNTSVPMSELNQSKIDQYMAGSPGLWIVSSGDRDKAQTDLAYAKTDFSNLPVGSRNALDGMFHLSDYVSDFTGATDQTSQLQTVVNAAGALYSSSGRPQTIYWDKQGTVQVTSITWAPGVSLRSPHYSLACLVAKSASDPVINGYGYAWGSPIQDVQIEGIEFDGSQAPAPTTYAVGQKAIGVASNGRNVAVRRCYVHDFCATGIATDSATMGCHVQDNLVVNCGRNGGKRLTITSVSGQTLTTSNSTTGITVGMVVTGFTNGLTAPAYASSGNYPVTVTAVTASTITISRTPSGTAGTVAIGMFANNGGSSGIGIGDGDGSSTYTLPTGTGMMEPQFITGNLVIGCTNYGIFHEGQTSNAAMVGSGVIVANNVCVGNSSGIGLCGTIGQVCEGNICISNSRFGIANDYGTLGRNTSRDALITGNVCAANGMANIAADFANLSSGSGSQVQHGRVTIIGNTSIGGSQYGIALYVGNATNNLTQPVKISENTVSLAGTSGIAVVPYSGGTATATNVEITRNHVYYSGYVNAAPGLLVNVPLTNSWIEDNKVFKSAGSTSQSYGLTLSQTFTGGSIRGNYFEGSTAGANVGANISATTWVGSNYGMPAPAAQTVTATASPMSYTAPTYPSHLIITGGTVSNVTVNSVPMPTSGVIPLEPLDAVSITYSAAPTLASRSRA